MFIVYVVVPGRYYSQFHLWSLENESPSQFHILYIIILHIKAPKLHHAKACGTR